MFANSSDVIRFAASLDPATGILTCDGTGISFHGDILAEFVQDSSEDSSPAPETDSMTK